MRQKLEKLANGLEGLLSEFWDGYDNRSPSEMYVDMYLQHYIEKLDATVEMFKDNAKKLR